MNIKESTKKEVSRLLELGVIKVSLEELKSFYNEIGLTICMDEKNYLLKYVNSSNKNTYLEATTSALDSNNICCFNIDGVWYKDNVLKQTEKYMRLKEIRNTYFCVLKSNHILTI